MYQAHRRRLSPALVIACIALAVALSGTGYAAIALSPNSVGTAELKNHAVTHPKIAPNAVTTGDVLNHSLLAVDFKNGQLPAGPAGPKGDKGDKGDTGPIGPSDAFVAATGDGVTVGSSTAVQSISLQAGTYALIGRVSMQDNSAAIHIVRCLFSPSATNVDSAVTVPAPGYETTIEISDAVNLAASGNVNLVCENFGGTTTAYRRVIEAIKVGHLTGP